jgi:hypothetical protein
MLSQKLACLVLAPLCYATLKKSAVLFYYISLGVIKSGCNRSDNKIQSSELEPVIIVACTPCTCQNVYDLKHLFHPSEGTVSGLCFYYDIVNINSL